jgi:PAS domain S-box-containing protein
MIFKSPSNKVITASSIAIIYFIICSLYIIASDKLLLVFISENITNETLTQIQTYKGIFFVLFSSFVIYVHLKRRDSIVNKYTSSLKNNQKQYQDLFKNMSHGVIYATPDGIVTSVNQSTLDILGITKKQMIGKSLFDDSWRPITGDGERIDVYENPTKKAIRNKKPERNHIVGAVNVKTGLYTWLKVNAIPEFEKGNDEPFRVCVTIDDVTLLKNYQEQLEESKEQINKSLKKTQFSEFLLKEASKLAKIGAYELYSDNQNNYFSDELYAFFEVPTNEEFPLERIPKLLTETSNALLQEGIKNCMEAGTVIDEELQLKMEDDRHLWVRAIIKPIYNENNKIVGRTGVIQDITASKKVQIELETSLKSLEKSEYSFREAGKMAKIGYWGYDKQTDVIFWSDEIHNIYGIPPEAGVPKLAEIHNFFTEKSKKELIQATIELATNGTPFVLELNLINAKKENIWIRNLGQPLYNENHEIIGRRGVSQNITSEKNAQLALLKAKEKAEKSEYTMNQASKLAKIGNWYYDYATQKLTWSEYLYRLYNLTPEDNIPNYEEALGYFDAKSQEKIIKATKKLDENGTSYDLELRMINAKNEEIWIRNVVEPVYNENKKIIGKRGVIRNITEEKGLRELNRDVAKMVKIGSWSIDLEKNTLFWSKQIHQLHETDPKLYVPNFEEALSFYREDFRQMVQSQLENTIKTGAGWDFEAVIVTVNKNEIWVRSIGNAEFSNDKCVRIYGGLQDINVRKQAEDRLQSLAYNLPGIIYKYAIYPDGTDALLHISGDVEKIWGFTANQLLENLDLLWDQIKLGGDFEAVQANLQKSIQTKSKCIISFRYVTPTGKVRNLLGFASPRFLADGTIIFNVILLDNTQQAKNEDLLALTGKLARIGGWEVDLVSNAVYWTNETHLIHETDPDSFIPNLEGAINFYRKDFHELVRSSVQECIATGEPYQIEAVLITANKKELWVRSNAKAEFINGECTRVYGSIQDIHELKTANLLLKKNIKVLEDYKFSLDQSAIIAFTNQKGEITSINDNFSKISGYSRNEAIGKTHRIINSGYHPKSFFKELWKTIASGKVWRGEVKNKAKDGAYYWVDTTIVPFLNEKNKPTEYLSIRIDITERKKTEESFIAASERLRLATTSAKLGIWDWDVVNDKLTWDDRMYELYGVKEEDFEGAVNAWTNGLHPDDVERASRDLQTALDGISDFKSVFRVIWPDESVHYLEGTAIVSRDADGNAVRMIGSNIDITEAKNKQLEILQAKEKIEASEAKFKSYTEKSPFVVYTTNVEGECNYLNKTWVAMSGMSRKESLGKGWIKAIHPDDVDLVNANWFKSIESKGKFKYEYRYIHQKDKRIVWVEGTAKEMLNEKNELIGYIGNIIDITVRKKAEEERTRFQETIENSLNEIFMFDAETFEFDYANNGALLNLGYTLEEIKKLTPLDIKPEFTKSAFNQLVIPLKTSELEKIIFFTNHQRKNGSLYPVEIHLQLVKQQNNNRFLAIILDLTEKKKAEEMYRLLADNTNDIITLQDENFSFTYVSPAIETLLGYKPDELLQKELLSVIHKEDVVIIKETLTEKLFKGIEVKSIVFRAYHKKGHFIWLESLLSPIIKANRIISIVSSTRDITESILAKNKIEDYQMSLQSLTSEISLIEEKQKKEIAANIHDHLSQSLVISKMRISDLEKKDELKNVSKDLDFIKKHISDALDNSRKITYDLSPPVLYQLGLIDAIDWFADETQEKYAINFQANSNVDTIQLSEFKSILLFRCIQEAVTNTIKYAEASLIILNLTKEKETVSVVITDNGKGFDTKKLNSNVNSGSGFGLFAVKERIRNMNGTLEIISEINIGTKIKIIVPLE